METNPKKLAAGRGTGERRLKPPPPGRATSPLGRFNPDPSLAAPGATAPGVTAPGVAAPGATAPGAQGVASQEDWYRYYATNPNALQYKDWAEITSLGGDPKELEPPTGNVPQQWANGNWHQRQLWENQLPQQWANGNWYQRLLWNTKQKEIANINKNNRRGM